MFEENAELLVLFDKFQELKTKEEQVTSEELAEHATKVMESLDEGIRSLDDVDAFLNFVHQIGVTHRKIPGFKAEYFWVSSMFVLFLLYTLRTIYYCSAISFISYFYGYLFDINFV